MRALLAGAAAVLLTSIVQPIATPAFAASEVAAVVNRTAITSGDIGRRVAFLKLQRAKGDLNAMARQQMIDETLKRQEVIRVQMSVSTQEVDATFARFASNNKMTVEQLGQMLDRAGVGVDHFKAYIAISMSWPRVVNARYGKGGKMSREEVVQRMLENKQKPVTTEYFLQQVIFVIPASKKNAITGKRKAEAEASRTKFPGCEQSKAFAATMMDVSIRNLGRVLAPELPPEWKPLIEGAKGNTTAPRVTERGVEYLAICKQRQVSDDLAAEIVFRAEDIGKQSETGKDPNDEKYVAELRKKAQIVNP
ncbi:peptidylprolyl isomerase [Rhizobiaceae bacterium n13]|uniref:Peptidylprolyl isomerase n=2 Tax=Ferirhizobium litorale TaxID=2927786 RepID=A0AAE3QDH5_9HYPH|nr:peptidylprolyl isomerase [Fererhizobium litorale]MDI7861082.1 peptidylprolyl isomerase [Fererhizobium litorale]MDI7921229.1 peptidylprolyl isomerase [Fererhizobium litorale]